MSKQQTPSEQLSAQELAQRLSVLERHTRNMRLAIIVIVAFFIYEALAPDGFHDRTHQLSNIETQDLRIVDAQRETLLRLSANENGAAIVLNGVDGARTTISPRDIKMYPFAGEPERHLQLTPAGVRPAQAQ